MGAVAIIIGISILGGIVTQLLWDITDMIVWLPADVAQLAEQLICNQQVKGSSPLIGFQGQSYINGF